MGPLLHRVLHEVAAAVVLEDTDVERVVVLGRARLRRRIGAAGVALAVVLAAAAVALQEDDDEPPPPEEPADGPTAG